MSDPHRSGGKLAGQGYPETNYVSKVYVCFVSLHWPIRAHVAHWAHLWAHVAHGPMWAHVAHMAVDRLGEFVSSHYVGSSLPFALAFAGSQAKKAWRRDRGGRAEQAWD
jgi:hypothetical protein